MIELKIRVEGVKVTLETDEDDKKQKEIDMLIYELEKLKQQWLNLEFKGDVTTIEE